MELSAERKLPDFDFVRGIADGVSTQSRFANRIWLALMILTFVVLVHAAHPSEQDKTSLPFQLGTLDTTVFHAVSCPMLAVLLIAFLAAHAQQVRAADLAQRVIDEVEKEKETWPHPRDIYDVMRHPTLIRVAPLPQLARGKYQFYPESYDCPLLRRILTTSYYVVLKLLGIIVYFFLPIIALCFAFYRFAIEPTTSLSWLKWVVGVFVTVAFIASIQAICIELRYVFHVVKVIGRKPRKQVS